MNGYLSSPTRRFVLIGGASGALLSACDTVIGPTNSSARIYVLAPEFHAMPDAPKVAWQLSIANMDSSQALNTTRIALRRSDTMDYYAGAQWTDSAPQLLQGLLLEAFEKSGKIEAVADDTAGIHAEYILQGDMRAFEAQYRDENGAPTVVVDIMAKLVVAHSRDIVGVHEARRESAASANSVSAVVQAFGTATSGVLEEITAWALAAGPTERRARKP